MGNYALTDSYLTYSEKKFRRTTAAEEVKFTFPQLCIHRQFSGLVIQCLNRTESKPTLQEFIYTF